jgi:hypothetical protein
MNTDLQYQVMIITVTLRKCNKLCWNYDIDDTGGDCCWICLKSCLVYFGMWLRVAVEPNIAKC